MRRREFIAGLGGTAAWPIAARAQQGKRRIGVLVPLNENAPGAKSYVAVFTQALADLGWADGRNVQMDLRWGGTDQATNSCASARIRLSSPEAALSSSRIHSRSCIARRS